MSVSVLRLPLSLHPLIAEAKRRVRRRRLLATAVIILIAAAAVGLTLGLRSGGSGGFETAHYEANGLSLRYPTGLTRVDWCRSGLHFSPIAILTTAHPAPKCTTHPGALSFPPGERLGNNGVSIELARQVLFPAMTMNWNARVAEEPAHAARPSFDDSYQAQITCPAGQRREYRSAAIESPQPQTLLVIDAVICGPQLAAGNRTVDGILGTLRVNR